VKFGDALADNGDSGGPLLCGGSIAGVAWFKSPNAEWPNFNSITYTTVDVPWINSTIAPVYTELALQNGWTNAPFATRNASAALVSNIVQLDGAIATTGTNAVAFTLPAAFRPSTNVYVPVDLCSGTQGRLAIASSGVVTVEAAGGTFSNAQCFTSLEGVSFARTTTGFTSLALQNGWTNAPFATSAAMAADVGGIVHLKGAVASGASGIISTLPAELRPATDVYVNTNLCAATRGRIHVQPSGAVIVEAEGGTFSNAQCFTSLDGVSFARAATGFTSLALQNGWTNAPFATSNAAVQTLSGVVHFKGAIATTGTNLAPFTLPAAYRPTTNVYLPVDLCNGTKGRLFIPTTGAVSVSAENGTTTNAQCFTSLDGVSYTLSNYTPAHLLAGWTSSPFSTGTVGYTVSANFVQFKGAMSTTGTDALAFVLPSGTRPSTNVYVPVNLCGATKGRILVESNGAVSVQAEGGTFSNASCFTSLDGVSFALSTTGSTALTLANGWTNAPFATRNAAVINAGGFVRFIGAIATTGTNAFPFTLPAGFRPSTDVYVGVDLCSATKGRLHVTPEGAVDVQAENGTFSNASCFTSLEGAAFALSSTGFTAVTPTNGWVNAPFATRAVAAQTANGIVRLQGAIATGSNASAFTLPVGMRPSTNVYVTADMCSATKGRVLISSSGTVTPQAQGAFTNAQCFTSLEGVSFGL
jgi:hypothetical protein